MADQAAPAPTRKRWAPVEDGPGSTDDAKKPRLGDGAAAAPAAPAKPGLSLEALEKAKKALQLQKQLKEKLKKLPQLQKPAAAAPGATPAVVPPTPAAPLSAAPQAAGSAPPAAVLKPPLVPPSVAPPPQAQQEEAGPPPEVFHDPRMGDGALKKLHRRTRATFEFVEHGEFQRAADAFRMKARFGRDALPPIPLPPVPRGPIGPEGLPGAPAGQDGGAVSVGGAGGAQDEEAEEDEGPGEPVPDVEPWDRGLLATGTYAQDVPEDPSQPVAVKTGKITRYVEHPVPIQPPAEAPAPPPQPLKLTTKELKKLRTQRRQAREKEKRDLIRQGLLEPPKPKVKLSNLYRVLGEQAVMDPTAIELETKRQMEERRAAHEDRNLARQLTPAERREKKLKKLFDDTSVDLITSVFKVSRLDAPQNRFKVDVNAKENHMTGITLVTPAFTVVVVEGCKKSTKRYTKLMLRRIDWGLPPAKSRLEGEGEEGADMDEDLDDVPPATCDLVWQGIVKEPSFQGFKVETCRTVEHAQQVLLQRGVKHYWDAAEGFIHGESIPVEELE